MTLKEIALDLLDKYDTAEQASISQNCYDVLWALEEHVKEIEAYRRAIEEATE